MESQLCLSRVVPDEPHFLHLRNGMSRHRGNSRFAQPSAWCTEVLPECSGNTSSHQGLLRPLCRRFCAVQAGDGLRSLHPLLPVLPAVWLVADTQALSAHVLPAPHNSAPHSSGSQPTSAGLWGWGGQAQWRQSRRMASFLPLGGSRVGGLGRKPEPGGLSLS